MDGCKEQRKEKTEIHKYSFKKTTNCLLVLIFPSLLNLLEHIGATQNLTRHNHGEHGIICHSSVSSKFKELAQGGALKS